MMVEDDPRLPALVHAQAAGLKRLSAPPIAAPIPSRVCFSFAAYARNVIHHLRECQVEVAEGLSDEEFARVELRFGFTFPPDLKEILKQGLPLGHGFPNWRSAGSALLRMKLNDPISSLCYEVAKGRLWFADWGLRPAHPHQAMAIARSALRKIPILLPVFKNCYIPSSPAVAGNPIFLVDRKVIGYSGFDLADFFQRQSFLQQEPNINNGPSTKIVKDREDGELKQSVLVDVHKDPYRGRGSGNGEMLKLTSLKILLEGSGWKSEGLGRDVGAQSRETLQRSFKNVMCGRRLADVDRECSSRSAQVSPRNSMSCLDLPRRSIDSLAARKSTPSFTVPAPVWAAKQPRHIVFWSDLVEKAKQSDLVNNGSMCYAPTGDNPTLTRARPAKAAREENIQMSQGLGSKWVARYLNSMAGELRNGGWKENEISEMVDANAYSDLSCKYGRLDKQSVLEDIASKVNMLSISLKRGGWTAQEVAEALGGSHGKENSKTPKQFAAKVEKLASAAQNLARA